MQKILLPTIDAVPARGGVARYIEAIRQTYPENVEVLKLSSMNYPALSTLFWQRKDVDAFWIHHVLPVGTAAWIMQRFTRKPYMIFLHGMDFDLARRNAWKRWLLKNVLQHAQNVVVNSRALANEVQIFADLDKAPLVVYPPVSDELVRASNARGTPNVDGRRRPENADVTLLTVSRLVERKGHLKVLRALQSLPGVRYHIVGDGPMRTEIERSIQELGLRDRVTMTLDANDEQLAVIYRNADIFVMPTTKTATDREGFGIVYLEAQLFGLPVIATRHPGVDEAIQHEASGLLCEDTPEALLAALERLLADPDLRTRFGGRGRTRVLDHFTREKQMSALTTLLE